MNNSRNDPSNDSPDNKPGWSSANAPDRATANQADRPAADRSGSGTSGRRGSGARDRAGGLPEPHRNRGTKKQDQSQGAAPGQGQKQGRGKTAAKAAAGNAAGRGSGDSPGAQVKKQALNRFKNRGSKKQGHGQGQGNEQDQGQDRKRGRTRSAAKAAAGQAARKSLTAGLTSLGVPTPIAAKISDIVVKYGPKVIAAAVLAGLMLVTAVLVSLFGGSFGSLQAEPTGVAATEIPGDVFEIYRAAGEKHDVPWTLLAGIGWVATLHGSEGPDDLKNYEAVLNRRDGTLRYVEGRIPVPGYNVTADYAVCGGTDCTVWPPIGLTDSDTGHGTFLLSTEFVKSEVGWGHRDSLTHAADALAETIAEIMQDVSDETSDLSDYRNNPDSAELFWFDVLTHEDLPVVFPQRVDGEYALPVCAADGTPGQSASSPPGGAGGWEVSDTAQDGAIPQDNPEEFAEQWEAARHDPTDTAQAGDEFLAAAEAALEAAANPQVGDVLTVDQWEAAYLATQPAGPQVGDSLGAFGSQLCVTEEEAERLKNPELSTEHSQLRAFAECGPTEYENNKRIGWSFTVDRFDKLCADAEAAGQEIKIVSAWRSQDHQNRLWRAAVKKYGSADRAAKWVARPLPGGGCTSNHCTGTAIDFAQGDALKWMRETIGCAVVTDTDSNELVIVGGGRTSCYSHEREVMRVEPYGFHFPLWWENWHMELTLNKNDEQLRRRLKFSSNNIGQALETALRYGGTMRQDPRVDRDALQ